MHKRMPSLSFKSHCNVKCYTEKWIQFRCEPRIDMWYITLEWVYVQLLSRNVSNVVCQRWWKEDSNVCLNFVLMLLIYITFWHANISFSCYYSFYFQFLLLNKLRNACNLASLESNIRAKHNKHLHNCVMIRMTSL